MRARPLRIRVRSRHSGLTAPTSAQRRRSGHTALPLLGGDHLPYAPGQRRQFVELTKLCRDASLKSGQNVPWATLRRTDGCDGRLSCLVPMTSLKMRTTGLAQKKGFGAALGDEGSRRNEQASEERRGQRRGQHLDVIRNGATLRNPGSMPIPKYWAPSRPQSPRGNSPPSPAAPKAPPATLNRTDRNKPEYP